MAELSFNSAVITVFYLPALKYRKKQIKKTAETLMSNKSISPCSVSWNTFALVTEEISFHSRQA